MSPLPSRTGLVVVAVLLLLGVSWQFGRMSVQRSAVATLDGAVEASARVRAEAERERLEAERDAALASLERLERALAERGRTSSEDAAELDLYRRIESGQGARGLTVEGLELVDSDGADPALLVTLVQSRGRRRVVGNVSLGLLGPDDADTGRSLGPPTPFDLRFFQTVRVPLGADADVLVAEVGTDPDAWRVRVAVEPDGDRHDPFVAIVPLGTKVATAPEE